MRRTLILAVLFGFALLAPLTSWPLARDPRSQTQRPPQARLIAERGYERLLLGRRATVMRVTWTREMHDGRPVVRDVTRSRSRSARDMAGHIDVFEVASKTDLLRTEDGELITMTTEVQLASRTDSEEIRRTRDGYAVVVTQGENREAFTVRTDRPVHVDAESFLVTRIRNGKVKPGDTFTMLELATARRKVIESSLRVIGPDEEGPGLKVEQTTLGQLALWWFAPDGAVMRIRSGDSVTRRADHLALTDLPRRPAVYPVTLSSNIAMPRLFTGQRMVVDLEVRTDDTFKLPRFPDNPFTEVVEEVAGKRAGRVRLLLKKHDDAAANIALPIAKEGFEEHLKATPLMEVDDPRIRRLAKKTVGDAKDARTAAARIADFVYRLLDMKGFPEMAEPTALEILQDPAGDCSEHCLLFTTLCRAAGIPARRCSGYVCIGGDWGGHAWCEIWVGKWIGADPTTNEIGTRARYIFCGRQDDPDDERAVLEASRSTILIRSAGYVDGEVDVESGKMDPAVFTGLRFGDVPDHWRVVYSNGSWASLLTTKFRVDAVIEPDQGRRALDLLTRRLRGGEETTFGGRPAVVFRSDRVWTWIVPLGRQNMHVRAAALTATEKLPLAQIEAAFKPTLDREE